MPQHNVTQHSTRPRTPCRERLLRAAWRRGVLAQFPAVEAWRAPARVRVRRARGCAGGVWTTVVADAGGTRRDRCGVLARRPAVEPWCAASRVRVFAARACVFTRACGGWLDVCWGRSERCRAECAEPVSVARRAERLAVGLRPPYGACACACTGRKGTGCNTLGRGRSNSRSWRRTRHELHSSRTDGARRSLPTSTLLRGRVENYVM